MSNYDGPYISNSGLVLCLDAGNGKSYPGSGTTWTDLSGNGANATLINAPTYSNGSFLFNNGVSNQYATASTATSTFNFGTGDFSIFLWMKQSYISNYVSILSLDNSSSGNGIVFYGHTGAGTFRTWVAGQVKVGNIVVCTGNWINIGITRLSGLVTHYVNGNSDVNFSAPSSLLTNQTLGIASNISSGPGGYAGFPSGNISSISIYNRSLSGYEITNNFNALRGRYNV